MTPNSIPGYWAVGDRGCLPVYNEAAFRYLLAVDSARAHRVRRRVLLVLVTVRDPAGCRAQIPHATASPIFNGLTATLRKTDFVGWYREHRVAGAALLQGPEQTDGTAARRIAARVESEITSRLSGAVAARVGVRVVGLGAGGRS